MAVYSSTLRYTGLSGIDTEGMVRALMNAESIKYNNLKAQTQKIEWKQEAYRSAADKLKSFQSSFLDIVSATSLRSSGTFSTFSTTIKNSSGTVSSQLSVKTSSTSVAGKHTIKVNSLADKDVYVSNKLVGGEITGEKTAMNVLKDLSGALTEYSPAEYDYVEDENGKYIIDGDGNYVLHNEADGEIGEGVPRFSQITVNPEVTAKNSVGFRLNIDGVIKNITLSKEEIEEIGTDNTSANRKKLVDKLNEKIEAAFGSGKVNFAISNIDGKNYLQLQSSHAGHSVTMSLPTDGSANFLEVMGTSDAGHAQFDNVTQKTLKDMLGANAFNNGEAVITINGKEITVYDGSTESNKATTVSQFMAEVNKVGGVKLSYDSFALGFKLEATATGVSGQIKWGTDTTSNALFAALGFDNTDNSHISKAQDAEFEYNGTTTSRSTNSFTLSNMTFSLDEASAKGETFTIEIKKDNQSTLDTIKKFVEAYNSLIGDMNGMTGQTRAKKSSYDYYEPLTDEQKEEMTENQIEKWESKAKEGILYRDDILGGITSSMRSWLYEGVDLGNGKKISLYEIGITTSSRTQDQGRLIINEEKLAKALEERSGDVLNLFTKSSSYSYSDTKNKRARMQGEGIAERLNDIINDAIYGSDSTIAKKAGLKGQVSEFTNDLYYQLKDQNENLSDMLKYLTRKETNYYAMFSKLETAMTKANAQASYLASQLGM